MKKKSNKCALNLLRAGGAASADTDNPIALTNPDLD